MTIRRSALGVGEVGKGLGLEFGELLPEQLDFLSLLLGPVEELPVDGNLLKLLHGLRVPLAVFADHHLLDLLPLLDRGLQIPFLRLELLVLLSDGLDFESDFVDFALEVSDALVALLPDLLHLLFEGFNLVFVHFGVLLGQRHLHLLLHLQHLDLLYHGVQSAYQFLLLLEVQGLLGHAYFAGLYLLHHLYLFVRVHDDFSVFVVDL